MNLIYARRNKYLEHPLTVVCQSLLNIKRFVQKMSIRGLQFRKIGTLEHLKYIRHLAPIQLS